MGENKNFIEINNCLSQILKTENKKYNLNLIYDNSKNLLVCLNLNSTDNILKDKLNLILHLKENNIFNNDDKKYIEHHNFQNYFLLNDEDIKKLLKKYNLQNNNKIENIKSILNQEIYNITLMPDEILEKIAINMEYKELIKLINTNKEFKIFFDNYFWLRKAKKDNLIKETEDFHLEIKDLTLSPSDKYLYLLSKEQCVFPDSIKFVKNNEYIDEYIANNCLIESGRLQNKEFYDKVVDLMESDVYHKHHFTSGYQPKEKRARKYLYEPLYKFGLGKSGNQNLKLNDYKGQGRYILYGAATVKNLDYFIKMIDQLDGHLDDFFKYNYSELEGTFKKKIYRN